MSSKDLETQNFEVFDLRGPQKTLLRDNVPAYVHKTDGNADIVARSLRQIVTNPKRPMDEVALWASTLDAFNAFVASTCGKTTGLRIATWSPSSIDIASGAHTIAEISRDPDDWAAENFENCDLVLIQNPSLWDGYYLPEDLLAKGVAKLHIFSPTIPVFVDQRNLVFCWEDLSPGDARRFEISNPYAILGSTHPSLAPNLKTEIAWTVSSVSLKPISAPESAANLAAAYFVLSSFKTKQGPFASEFHKIMLVVRESLKRISSSLQLLAEPLNFKITHWPSSGLYLKLQCPTEIDAKRLQKTFLSHGIETLTLESYGEANSIVICYAMHLSQCDRLLKRLTELRLQELSI